MRPGLDPHVHALTYHVASQARTVGGGWRVSGKDDKNGNGRDSGRDGERESRMDGRRESRRDVK